MRTSGAGPRTTLPWLLYCEPWHGHMNLFSACRAAPGLSNRTARTPAPALVIIYLFNALSDELRAKE